MTKLPETSSSSAGLRVGVRVTGGLASESVLLTTGQANGLKHDEAHPSSTDVETKAQGGEVMTWTARAGQGSRLTGPALVSPFWEAFSQGTGGLLQSLVLTRINNKGDYS